MTLSSPPGSSSSCQTQSASLTIRQSSDPVGTGNHEAQPGDCIESIAYVHGLFWKTVWNHPENNQLRVMRRDPNVILAGDGIFVSDLQMKEISGAVDGEMNDITVSGIKEFQTECGLSAAGVLVKWDQHCLDYRDSLCAATGTFQ